MKKCLSCAKSIEFKDKFCVFCGFEQKDMSQEGEKAFWEQVRKVCRYKLNIFTVKEKPEIIFYSKILAFTESLLELKDKRIDFSSLSEDEKKDEKKELLKHIILKEKSF